MLPRRLARSCPALLVLVALARAAHAAPAPGEAVPLAENYSPLETTFAVSLAVAGAAAMVLGPKVLGSPAASMGAPEPDSLDARIARSVYRADGTDRQMWLGIPDIAGSRVIPFLPGIVYGAGALSLAFADHPLWPTRDLNPQHRLVAYLETLGWTYVVTGLFKHTVGRPRPYTEQANKHPELRPSREQDRVSFFSGHASGTFAAGAFVARDASNYLHRYVLDDEGPAVKLLVGTLLPYSLGYGIPALVALSRVVDQQHWPSDVVIGALTGALVANLVYDAHFDGEGQPRRRHPREANGGLGATRIVPLVEVTAEGERQASLALVGRF